MPCFIGIITVNKAFAISALPLSNLSSSIQAALFHNAAVAHLTGKTEGHARELFPYLRVAITRLKHLDGNWNGIHK